MKRQRWVLQIAPGKVLAPGIKHNKCAICRHIFGTECADCKADNSSVDEVFANSENLLYTLLLYAKRPPFNAIPRDILSRIYNMALPECNVDNCPVVQLICNHVFHEHCIEKWLNKRKYCPLCDTFTGDRAVRVTLSVQSPRADLLKHHYVNPETPEFISQKKLHKRRSKARAFIYRLVKRVHPAKWPKSAIVQMYLENTPKEHKRITEIEIDEILKDLCNKKHFKQLTPNTYMFCP